MKQSIAHKVVSKLKDYFEQLNEKMERNAKLKDPLNLPAVMSAEEALNFLYERYFGDEYVMDTGPAVQAYPIMVKKICWYIDIHNVW